VSSDTSRDLFKLEPHPLWISQPGELASSAGTSRSLFIRSRKDSLTPLTTKLRVVTPPLLFFIVVTQRTFESISHVLPRDLCTHQQQSYIECVSLDQFISSKTSITSPLHDGSASVYPKPLCDDSAGASETGGRCQTWCEKHEWDAWRSIG